MKGDPVIECVSSELIMSKERTTSAEEASYGDIIFYLDVQLKTVRHFSSSVNATLRFKNRASLAVEQTMTGEENDPVIIRDQTTWNALERGKAKSALLPFTITGFQRLPEKIEFELDVIYTNPNDEEIYATTLSIIPWIPDTTINIVTISNPPNKPKGDSVPISITVENTGNYNAYGLAVGVRVKSIGAGTSTSLPYRNAAGSIVLQSAQIVLISLEYIAPHSQRIFNYNIPCHGYSNGAMNLGIWKLIHVEAFAYNSPTDIVYENDPMISDPDFSVTTKAKSAGPHAVFAYYLWNSGGTGDNWAGDNPKNYFINGYGGVYAGLWRFSQPSSNIPVLLNPMIAYDDSTWSIPDGMHNVEELRDNGIDYIESKLGITYWWRHGFCSYRSNCGFDILLMAAGRRGDVAGLQTWNSVLVCKWRIGLPSGDQWKDNIDGTVQHEVSHLFGTVDVVNGHAITACIMVYWTLVIPMIPYFIPISYLYEHMSYGIALQTGNWGSSCCCQTAFNDNWGKYYTIDIVC